MQCIQFRCTVFQVPIHSSIHRIESNLVLPKTPQTPKPPPIPPEPWGDGKSQSGPGQYEQKPRTTALAVTEKTHKRQKPWTCGYPMRR